MFRFLLTWLRLPPRPAAEEVATSWLREAGPVDLEEEHEQIQAELERLLRAVDSGSVEAMSSRFALFSSLVLRHFAHEETILRDGRMAGWDSHRGEHETLRRMLDNMRGLIGSSAEPLWQAMVIRRLLSALGQHFHKEHLEFPPAWSHALVR